VSDLADLADKIRDLVEPGRHTTAFRIWKETPGGKNEVVKTHTVDCPSLLDQLRDCRYDRAQTETDTDGPARTVPHVDIDAIDRVGAIRAAVAQWLKQFRIKSRATQYEEQLNKLATDLGNLTGGLWAPPELYQAASRLRVAAQRMGQRCDYDLPALVGAAANTDPDTAAVLDWDVARWRTWCRIFAGWETPPWRPRARCPHCDAAAGVGGGRPAGLRVRLDIRSAVCLSCSTTWSDRHGGVPVEILAEHIRQTCDQPLTAEQVDGLRDLSKRSPTQNRGGRS
jgi:hypothetical protein